MDSYDELDRAFKEARKNAVLFIESYNARLPSKACPSCRDAGHLPGIRCPACGYLHGSAWLILRDTEWGYEAITLTNRRGLVAYFPIKGSSSRPD